MDFFSFFWDFGKMDILEIRGNGLEILEIGRSGCSKRGGGVNLEIGGNRS